MPGFSSSRVHTWRRLGAVLTLAIASFLLPLVQPPADLFPGALPSAYAQVQEKAAPPARDKAARDTSAAKRHRATEITIDEDGIRIGTGEGQSRASQTAQPSQVPEPPQIGKDIPEPYCGSSIVRFGQHVVVEQGQVVSGDVVIIGGSVDVYGKVSGDVVAIGGTITLHEGAVVNGDAVSVGGSVDRYEGSEIHGEEVSVGTGVPFLGRTGHLPFFGRGWNGWPFGAAWRLISFMIALAISIGLSWLFILIFGTQVERISGAVTRDAVKAGLIGILTAVALPPLMVLLCVTIIGIPAALIIGLLWFLADVFGMVGVSAALGGRIARATSLGHSPYLATTLGLLALFAIPILGGVISGLLPIPFFGWFVTLTGILILMLASAVGMGGVVWTRFGSRSPTSSRRGPAREVPPSGAPTGTPGPAGPGMSAATAAGEPRQPADEGTEALRKQQEEQRWMPRPPGAASDLGAGDAGPGGSGT